jgi:hypothetical protein
MELIENSTPLHYGTFLIWWYTYVIHAVCICLIRIDFHKLPSCYKYEVPGDVSYRISISCNVYMKFKDIF